ncbi:hypothetical protein HZS_1795 [Henneguya salminicola]|nr:hypothetical protein HZS_1795 [Henneguya salminicola]
MGGVSFLIAGYILILTCLNEKQEFGIDINPEDDVHLVYLNNYTNVLHIKMKWVAFVFKDHYSMEEGSVFNNYSMVAKNLKEKNFFTKINATVMPYLIEDFLDTVPGIIFFANKTAYVYKEGFSYEEIFKAAEDFSRQDWMPEPSPIIYLNQINFESIFYKIDYGIFMLIGHDDPTRDMLYIGRLKTVSEKLKNHDISVFVVNNLTDSEISTKLNINDLGVLHIIRKGKLYVFKQEMQDQISSMVKHSISSRSFGSQLISNYKKGIYDIRKHNKEDLGIFVALISSKTSSWFIVYEEIVYRMGDHYKFYHTFDREIGRSFGCQQTSCLITIYPERLNSPYDEQILKENQLTKTELANYDLVEKYIKRTCRPLVGHLSNYVNVLNVYKGLFPKVILYMDVDFSSFAFKENQFSIKQLWKVAFEFQDLVFVFSNREDHETSLKEKKLDDSGNEVDLVIEDRDDYFYIMKEEFNYKNARNFIMSFQEGILRPILKSTDIPEKEFDENGIRTIVGQNFDDIVLTKDNDMIILFYVDWCEHCKNFIPIFSRAAKHFKDYNKLVFAKMNYEDNIAPPEYLVKAYPTLYFAQSHSKKNPIKYDKKSKDGFPELVSFIMSHLTFPKLEEKSLSDEL